MGPEVMRDESFRVSGPSKANLSPVRGGHYPVCGEPAWSSVSCSPSTLRLLVWAEPSCLFCHWAEVYSTQTFRLTLCHTAGFPEPPACRRRVVGCHSFLNGVNQFCIPPSYLCVYVSSIYESLYHLPVVSLSTQPSTYPSFSPLAFWEPLRHSLTDTEGHYHFFLPFTDLINLFAFTYSYSRSAFRFSFMILTAVLFPLESYVKHGSSLVIHPCQGISLQLQIPLKLKLLSPSPRLSIACGAGRCARTVFSLWVWFDFLLSTLPNLAHCEAVSSEYAVTEWNRRKHSFSRF